MQLPKELQRFLDPCLIVMTDEQEAKFWIAGGDALETLDSMSLVPEKESDREGAFHTAKGYTHVGSDLSDKHDTPRKEKFAKQITERMAKLIREGHAERVRLVSPPEMMHRLEKHLPTDVKKRMDSKLDKDLMKFDVLEVLKRMFDK